MNLKYIHSTGFACQSRFGMIKTLNACGIGEIPIQKGLASYESFTYNISIFSINNMDAYHEFR